MTEKKKAAPSRPDAFMAIGAFCRHADGCPQLTDAAGCTCGLLKAQNDLLAALYQIEPEAVPPVASAPDLTVELLAALKDVVEYMPSVTAFQRERLRRADAVIAKAEAARDRAPSPSPLHAETREDLLATAIVLAVAELPDRTSPDDWPEAMLVTADELRDIVTDALRASSSSSFPAQERTTP